MVQIALLLGLSVAAAGTGWMAGQMLKGDTATAAALQESDGKSDGEGAAAALATNLLTLQPITTNLASPSTTWARMEVALVFDGPPDGSVGEAVHQDFLAYLRTVRLQQVEGASGFQHLKSDLEERAGIRSGGKVKSVLINTLLFE